jgi:hypothetical protein
VTTAPLDGARALDPAWPLPGGGGVPGVHGVPGVPGVPGNQWVHFGRYGESARSSARTGSGLGEHTAAVLAEPGRAVPADARPWGRP